MSRSYSEWEENRIAETRAQRALRRAMNPKWTIRRRRLVRALGNFVWYLLWWTVVVTIGVWLGYLAVLIGHGYG